MGVWNNFLIKLNPVQEEIARGEGSSKGTTQTKLMTVRKTYGLVEVVNRGINMIVDSASQVGYDVADSLSFVGIAPTGIKGKTLTNRLNFRPNPYMDISKFRRLIFMDFLVDGNAFIYYDNVGQAFYHLPASKVQVLPSDVTFVEGYLYDGTTFFKQNEIIHIADNSAESVYRGDSRINCALNGLIKREKMQDFQETYFDNGAVVGLIVETEAILSKKLKERTEMEWSAKYNPKSGAQKPLILDGGMKARAISTANFRDMDFKESIDSYERGVAIALGIPPVLLNPEGNSNIRPNLELFFSMTIIPMLKKFEHAFEYFFAFDIQLVTAGIMALTPDQKAQADRLSALVNNGIMTAAEARAELRLEELEDPTLSEIRIPANIAGSATGVTGQEGGAPKKPALETE